MAELHAVLRTLKRRAGVTEEKLGIEREVVRIKRERLVEAEEEYEEEHRTFTCFSKQLEQRWERRYDRLASVANGAGVPAEDIATIRRFDAQASSGSSGTRWFSEAEVEVEKHAALYQAGVQAEVDQQAALQQAAAQAEADKQAALRQAMAKAEVDKQVAVREAMALAEAEKGKAVQ